MVTIRAQPIIRKTVYFLDVSEVCLAPDVITHLLIHSVLTPPMRFAPFVPPAI